MELSDETANREAGAAVGRCVAGRPLRGRGAPGAWRAALVKLMSPLAMVVVAATVLVLRARLRAGAAGRRLSRNAHRQALRGAIEALQAVSPDLGDVDPKLIRILESASGLKGLRLAEEPPQDAREVQSLIDSNGRIVGWFTWEPERPATAMITRLLPFGGLIALGLFGFAHAGDVATAPARLAARQEHARRCNKLAYEDPVTGLPNLHRMREFIDRGARQAATGRTGGGRADRSRRLRRDEGCDRRRRRGRGADRDRQPAAPRRAGGRADRAPARRQVRPGDARGRRGCGARGRAGDARRGLARRSGSIRWFRSAPMRGWRWRRATATRARNSMRRADLALRGAKRRGRGLIMQFSVDMEGDFDERRFIKRELSRALATRSFEVHYQPIVRADGGAIVGVEVAAALEPSEPRLHPAGPVRAGRGGRRADGSARRVRAAPGAGRCRALAGPLRRGQPVAGAGARPPVRGPGQRGARRDQDRSRARGAGDHRRAC